VSDDNAEVTDGGYNFVTESFGLVDTGAGWMIEAKDGSGEAIMVPEVELWRLADVLCQAHVAAGRKRGEAKRRVAKR
jgi:hypothetical protein